MQWREAAESLASDQAKQALLEEIRLARADEVRLLTDVLDGNGDLAQARQAVRRLMFIEKIYRDIDREQ